LGDRTFGHFHHGDLRATVTACDHPVGIFRVNPDVMEIILDARFHYPGLTSIFG
jgi:hypothetical protein